MIPRHHLRLRHTIAAAVRSSSRSLSTARPQPPHQHQSSLQQPHQHPRRFSKWSPHSCSIATTTRPFPFNNDARASTAAQRVLLATSVLLVAVASQEDSLLVTTAVAECSPRSTKERNANLDYTTIDQKFIACEFDKMNALLEEIPEHQRNYDWSWRMASCKYNMSENDSTLQSPRKKELVEEGYECILAALAENPNSNNVQRWYGILFNAHNTAIGRTEKIKHLLNVKKAWVRAVELNPNDASAYHLLGRWEQGLKDIDWFSRSVATRLFGALPDSSYEQAYAYYKSAENIRPGFWLNNKLKLAEICLNLGNKEEAKQHLMAATKIEAKTNEDKDSLKAVETLLKKHKWGEGNSRK